MIDSDVLYEALDEAELTLQARQHYSETSSYQGVLALNYERWRFYYAPPNGDQWPEDKAARPGMIHLTHNIIAPAVDVESRIESRLPRATLLADNQSDKDQRIRAEAAEKLMIRWLELSDWSIWLNEACKVKSQLGKTVLKPIWNKRDKRPDVSVIELPENLRIGWGSSDYRDMDWALYEYSISPLQAMRRWPDLQISKGQRKDGPLTVARRGADHADPLNQRDASGAMTNGGRINRVNFVQPSDYEGKQVRVWDYWCKRYDREGNEHITNAFFVEGVLAAPPTQHDYYPDLPFIVIEHDHEPGSPEGIGDISPLLDVQIELNRAFSHWAQLIADEIDPAWQINKDSVPSGIMPRGGQILPAGEDGLIKPIEKQVNQFPIQQLVDEFYKAFYFRSGLSEILFTQAPGAQTAGRALQIQIEAVANRIDPRRDRLYRGLKELLIFWAHMAEKINPQIEVGADENGEPILAGVGDMLKGFRRWKFIAPEITPRDNLEAITAVVNKLNAKLISLEDAMDELGVDSPLEMIAKIEAERTNPRLFPGDTQAFVAVLNMLQQYQATAQQLGLGTPDMGGGAPTAEQAAGQQQAEAQQAQPQGVQGDNGSGVPQPATAAGSPPPPGAPGPGGLQNQTLIRAQPSGGAQALQQIKVTT